MTAQNLMSVFLLPLKTTDTVEYALKMMEENKVSHQPVVDGANYLGLITETELLSADNDNATLVEMCKALPKPFVHDQDHYFTALKFIIEQKLSLLPVLDDTHNYVGLITAELLLAELGEALSVSNPGGIIIIEVNQNDYSLSEIGRIVESNDAKILSLSVKTHPDSTKLEITLKLNRLNLEPVIQSFFRYDYVIKYYFGDNEKNENLLRERYDLLMRYLNT
jgi:acetoin utilization protein AcuB